MGIKARVTMNQKKLSTLSNGALDALSQTAEQLRGDLISEQMLPYDEGILQNVGTSIDESDLHKGEVRIVHDTPYAARLYFHPEYNFSRDINAKAQGEWWEPWISGAKSRRPAQIFRRIYKRITGAD